MNVDSGKHKLSLLECSNRSGVQTHTHTHILHLYFLQSIHSTFLLGRWWDEFTADWLHIGKNRTLCVPWIPENVSKAPLKSLFLLRLKTEWIASVVGSLSTNNYGFKQENWQAQSGVTHYHCFSNPDSPRIPAFGHLSTVIVEEVRRTFVSSSEILPRMNNSALTVGRFLISQLSLKFRYFCGGFLLLSAGEHSGLVVGSLMFLNTWVMTGAFNGCDLHVRHTFTTSPCSIWALISRPFSFTFFFSFTFYFILV